MTTTTTSPASRTGSTPSGSPLAVRCKGVTKSFGAGDTKVVALRGVDLEVPAGELMMLVGPSGCGKTTLISVIAGILDRDAGDCEVFGIDFQDLSSGQRTKLRGQNIGFVFQQFNLLPTLTAAENVAVPLMILGEGRHEAVKKGAELLGRVGLGDRGKSLPSQLSGGQQQRVAIARALVHNPKLIVCDEPTSALDHETGHRVMELLRKIASEDNRTLLIVTHDSRIFSFADRIARMDDGHIEKIARTAEEIYGSAAAH
jgi:putative ABC transport system ATP-binding protein